MNRQQQPIRLAVVGGGRGESFNQSLAILSDLITLSAVCDSNDAVLKQWQTSYPGIRGYSDYDKLLDDPAIDAVLLATPLTIHARQAIKALNAGKHVLSEVIAAHTLEDAWELVETVEKTGLTYMLSENYCYMRPNMMVNNMVQKGLFGDITCVEGAYLHDCRTLTHYADGSLTWRGELNRNYNGMNYPTHSLGPVAQWLGINRGDELVSMTTLSTRVSSMPHYYRETFGESHPGSKASYWKQGDSSSTTILTKNGVIISLRLDWLSARPHNMVHYGLQGTNGAYLSARHDNEEPLVWLDGRSPGSSPWLADAPKGHPEWESLWKYRDEYDHPLWRDGFKHAEEAGHGGGDFFVIEEFARAIHEQRPPAIDVYDAVTWSSVFPLSVQSVAYNGQTVAFPNFTKNRKARP